MILILKVDLDIVKMNLGIESEVPIYVVLTVIAWTDRHTESEIITYRHRFAIF